MQQIEAMNISPLNPQTLPAGHPARNSTAVAQLLEKARHTANNAYAPYSDFHVGSALMTNEGDIFAGCNCETRVNEGLICGERNAVFNAVTNGAAKSTPRFIDMIVCACIDASGDNIGDGCPCGACRQVINEFAHPDTVVVVDDKKSGVLFRAADLLPNAFRFGPEQPTTIVGSVDIKDIERQASAPDITEENLVRLAQQASVNSYAPPSWGAAASIIINEDKKAVVGVRVVNSSTGLSINSDRVAVGRAVALGAAKEDNRFVGTIVTYLDKDEEPSLRQINPELLNEFGHRGTKIIIATRCGYMTAQFQNGSLVSGPTTQFLLG